MPFNLLHFLKKKNSLGFQVKTKAVFRYKLGYRRNGENYFPTDWKNNLILDSGLNKVAGATWENCFSTCLFGDQVSPTPVARNSGAITFTTTGVTCVASGSFFVSADVGRLIKFDDTDGQERYITAFTSGTTVTLGVAPSPSIAANTGTVWYVNETALDHLYASTGTYQQNAGDNQTTVSGNVVTMQRTFIGGAVAAPVTLTEIGFNDSSSNANLFDRDIITGGVAFLTGDQPLAIAQLILTMVPNTSSTVGNVGTGFNSAGNSIISGLNIAGISAIFIVRTNGTGGGGGQSGLEPSDTLAGRIGVVPSSFSLPAFSNGQGPDLHAIPADSSSAASYSNGNFYRDVTYTFGTATANGDIFGFIIGPSSQAQFTQVFTTNFTKLSTQVLTLTVRRSWQRILQN